MTLFQGQYFFFSKGESISCPSFISNACFYMMALPEQLHSPFISCRLSIGRNISLYIYKFHFPGYNPSEREKSQSISPLRWNFLLFELTTLDSHLQATSVYQLLRHSNLPASIHPWGGGCCVFQVGRNPNKFRKGKIKSFRG